MNAIEFLRKAFHVDSSLSLIEYFGHNKEFKIHDVVKLMNNYTDSLQSKNKQLSEDNEKKERIAYLKGITTHTIWADYVPNGNELCDKYQEELEKLIKETGKPSND